MVETGETTRYLAKTCIFHETKLLLLFIIISLPK